MPQAGAVSRSAGGVLRELIKDELTARSRAAAHQRTDTRTSHRNGHSLRTVFTQVRDVEVAM